MKLGNSLGVDEARVRPDEAGMCTGVDERPADAKHARHLEESGSEVIYIRMRPERHNGVEAVVLERQGSGVRTEDIEATVASPPQHVLRRVDACDLPAGIAEGDGLGAGTAADVQQSPCPITDQPEGSYPPRVVNVVEEVGVVPVGDAVVTSHRSMLVRLREPAANGRCRGVDMARGFLVAISCGLLLTASGVASPQKSPAVSLLTRPSGLVAGRPWNAVLVVRGSRPSSVGLTASLGRRRVSVSARGWRNERYRGRLVFPASGRWTLTARISGKRFRLGVVLVRAPVRPPLVLVYPTEAILEPSGSLLVAESGQSRIARIDPNTGRDTSVVRIVQPYGIALTPSGVLFATSESRVVRVGSGGAMTTIADAGEDVGPLALDGAGSLYFGTVARIFRIDSGTGAVTAYAGTGPRGGEGDGGPALQAELNAPHGLVIGADGALYVADTGNHRVRRIDPATHVISAVAAGDGPAGLAVGSGGVLYVAERDGLRVSRIDPSGTKTLVAGTGVRGNTGDGGPATGARLDEPFDVVPTASGALFILESGATGRIRRIAPSGTISTLTRR